MQRAAPPAATLAYTLWSPRSLGSMPAAVAPDLPFVAKIHRIPVKTRPFDTSTLLPEGRLKPSFGSRERTNGGTMKKSLFLLLCVLLLVFVGASPALAHGHGHTFVVHPSGGDDTAAIQAAFENAKAAGPGSTVQLTKGQFYMNNILVDGFRGCFAGAGMHKTVIDTLRGLNPGYSGVTLTIDPDNPGTPGNPNYLVPYTFLIGFLRSGVRVADMSFDITARDPSERYLFDISDPDSGWQTNLSNVFVVMRDSSSGFDCVGTKAHDGDVNDLNIEGDLVIADTGGVHSVTRCSFEGNNGLELGQLTGARLTIGGCDGMGNRFAHFAGDMYLTSSSDCRVVVSHNLMRSGYGCYFEDLSDSGVEVSGNRIQATFNEAVFILHGLAATNADELPPLPAPRYVVRDNYIVASKVSADHPFYPAGAGGLWVADESWRWGARGPTTVIADNTIVLDNGGRDGGINGFGARGVKVLYNRIRGTGIAGIDVGTDIYSSFDMPAEPTSGWKIRGNDVSKMDLVNAFGGDAAPIWLGTESRQCLVVGGCAPTEVLDQGTDNILINAIRLPLPELRSARAAAPTRALGRINVPGPIAKF
jgi:hypothetical protein